MTSMDKFKELAGNYAFADKYFNYDKSSVDLRGIEECFSLYSHGEQTILSFLVLVFTRVNHLEFNIIDAASILGCKDRELICNWLKDPFWP